MTAERKLKTIVKEIRHFCEMNANEKQAQRYERFFTEGYDAYGISTALFLEQKDRLIEKYQNDLTLDDFIHLGDLLIQSGKYEEASFAVRLLDPFHDKFQKKHFQNIGNWLESGICNWGHTDVLCSEVLSIFLVNHIISLDDLSSWRESPSKWKRRAVPVSLIDIIKSSEKTKDIQSLLDFIEPLMLDEDRFVHQGLGWFLREAWKKHPKPVEDFLLKHKDCAPRKIYQYATEKMTQEQKERFRAAKKKSSQK